MSLLVPVPRYCMYLLYVATTALVQYSTVPYCRDLLLIPYCTLAGQECDIKGGSKGGVPPGYVGGGFEEPKVPPPSSSRRQRTILNIRAMPCYTRTTGTSL